MQTIALAIDLTREGGRITWSAYPFPSKPSTRTRTGHVLSQAGPGQYIAIPLPIDRRKHENIGVFSKWSKTFSEFREFRESEKSLRHELSLV